MLLHAGRPQPIATFLTDGSLASTGIVSVSIMKIATNKRRETVCESVGSSLSLSLESRYALVRHLFGGLPCYLFLLLMDKTNEMYEYAHFRAIDEIPVWQDVHNHIDCTGIPNADAVTYIKEYT